MKTNDIERAVDTVLSGLTVTPKRQEELICRAMESCRREKGAKALTGRAAPPVKLKFRFSLSFGLSHMIVAAIVVVIVIVAPLFAPGQQTFYDTWQTKDNEHYMVQGHEDAPNPQVAEADNALPTLGYFQPATFEEARACYGAPLPALTFLPEGAALDGYSVSVLEVCRTCLTTYLTEDGIILFQVREFFEPTSAYTYVEQDGEGEHVQLSTGQTVYITTNGPYLTVVWQDGVNDFMLSGSFTREEAIRMAESVQVK